jgi:FkbM family methyltransferase
MDKNRSYNNTENDDEIELLKKIIKDNDIVFDVGARDSNIPLINDNVTYYLFEPIKWNYNRLFQRFNDYSNVKIITEGLSDKEEKTTIYLESESIHKRLNFNYIWNIVKPERVVNGETEEINCNTLKKYIEENNITKIDVLKIDVEGYEYNVLKGMYEHIDIVKNILFEYSIGTYTSSKSNLMYILKLLKDFDFYLVVGKDLEKLGNNLESIYDKLYDVSNCMIYAKRK